MSRLRVIPLTLLAGTLTFGFATPTHAEIDRSAQTDDTSSRANNFGKVANYRGSPVRIDCNYGSGPYYTLPEGYPNSNSASWSYCSDTDRFKSNGDVRCIKYTGPGYADGIYRLDNDVWRKVAGLARVDVYAYTSAQCGSKPWFNYV